jgi:acylpyruvate hydrolase
MRYVTLRTRNGTAAGRLEGDEIIELAAPDVGAVLAAQERGDDPAPTGATHSFATADLAPVVPAPGKIICLGLNYKAHIEEMGRMEVTYPTLFAKYTDALVGPRDDIVLPRASEKPDWEAELAFVIGRTTRHATVANALDAIGGYTVLNDVSMRDWQQKTLQWLQGKTFESSTPVGPVLVTPEEVDHAADLAIGCEVDGEVMQGSRTSDLLFGPAAIVEYVSTIVTLRPGDIISTGTPAGVGDGRKPPVYLKPGQVVRTVIEGIGELVNRCVPE